MVNKTYPIHGISAGGGADGRVPIRREFSEWIESKDDNDKKQVCLFFFALDRFQKVDPADRDSYFQIAGIHGFPYESWDEDSLTEHEIRGAGESLRGYCMHANALFPVWHRPYLLLYEQRIFEIMMKEIIPKRPAKTQAAWIKAAETWRLPFWDWAINPMSRFLSAPVLHILMDGENVALDNPMYKFKMPEDKNMGDYGVGDLRNPDSGMVLKYSECFATSRGLDREKWPTVAQWNEGFVDDNKANSMLMEHGSITGFDYGAASELVYRLLTYPLDWPHFATLARDIDETSATASTTSVTNDINLEFIHNNIHYWVGGDGGHMSQIPVATFDPVFWLHHCNIDRLFAIWQTLNQDVGRNTTSIGGAKNKWFNFDQQRYFDQKIVGSGGVITSKTPLRPFHKDENGTMWTPQDAINWYNLGYTYPELQPWTNPSSADYKEELFAKMNEAYGQVRKEALGDAAKSMEIVDKRNPDGTVDLNDYAVSVSFKKFAFNGEPFNLEVFLRPESAPKDRKTFAPEEYVTNVFNFSQPAERHDHLVCSNCADQQAEGVLVQSYVPLTSYLIKMIQEGRLDNLKPATVEQFLQGLYYRVTMNGEVVDEDKWQGKPEFGLKVDVSQMKMTFSENPTVQPGRTEPQILPTLGTGADTGATPPAVVSTLVPVNKITALPNPVSDGGSIVFKCTSSDPTKTSRESKDTLSLLSYPDGSTKDAFDEDSYDFVLSTFLRSKAQTLEFDSRAAGHSYVSPKSLDSASWIQGANATIRIDLKPNAFDIWIDEKKVGTIDRTLRGNKITHVRNWTMSGKKPILGREITVATYQSTLDVQE